MYIVRVFLFLFILACVFFPIFYFSQVSSVSYQVLVMMQTLQAYLPLLLLRNAPHYQPQAQLEEGEGVRHLLLAIPLTFLTRLQVELLL